MDDFTGKEIVVLIFCIALLQLSCIAVIYGFIYYSFDCTCSTSCVDLRYGVNHSDSLRFDDSVETYEFFDYRNESYNISGNELMEPKYLSQGNL